MIVFRLAKISWVHGVRKLVSPLASKILQFVTKKLADDGRHLGSEMLADNAHRMLLSITFFNSTGCKAHYNSRCSCYVFCSSGEISSLDHRCI